MIFKKGKLAVEVGCPPGKLSGLTSPCGRPQDRQRAAWGLISGAPLRPARALRAWGAELTVGTVLKPRGCVSREVREEESMGLRAYS